MTNEEAQGYVLMACKALKISREQAEKLIYEMEYQFDMLTGNEAKTRGFDWLYKKEPDINSK